MDISEDKFKLALATDLIIFISRLLTQSVSSSVNIPSLINELMNKWSERVDTSAEYMKDQIADQLADQGDAPRDVIAILLGVNSIYNKTLKGEFKTQMREAILKGLEIYDKQ